MPRLFDPETWNRRDHFHFFRGYDNPYFNLCAPVDVTAIYEAGRAEGGPSFFLATHHLSLRAANEVEAFRYRLRGDQVLVHDVVHCGTTVLRDDDTFAYVYLDYDPDFARFAQAGGEVLRRARESRRGLEPRDDRDDLVHYSVIPWVAFTSFSHARRFNTSDAVPKIVFGKRTESAGRHVMPVSVEVHHALADGLHVGRFFERFQELCRNPPGARPAGASSIAKDVVE